MFSLRRKKDSGVAPVAIPLLAIVCLVVILFAVAAIVVVALIPLYVDERVLAGLEPTGVRYFTFSILNSEIPALGIASDTACLAIVNSLAAAINVDPAAFSANTCTFASAVARRKRRSWSKQVARQIPIASSLVLRTVIDFTECPSCRFDPFLTTNNGVTFTSSFDFVGPTTATFTISSVSLTVPAVIVTASTTESTLTTTTMTTTEATTSNMMSR